jgi:hypothetical protein
MPKHLTDEQLLELEDLHHNHVASCEFCQQRLQRISEIRTKLIAMPLMQAPEINGLNINTQSLAKPPALGQTSTSTKNVFMWRTALVAMAASVVFVVAISWWRVTAPNNEDVYTALVQIIEKNNQVFDQSQSSGKPAILIDMQFDDELSRIESAIQNAYINHEAPEKKLRLWEQRHALLKKIKQSQQTTTRHKV